MEKKITVMLLLLCSIVLIAMPVVQGRGPNQISNGPNALKNWYRKLPEMKQKVTELHFFLHDIVSGPNPTNIPIALPNSSAHSPTLFGLIAAIDDPLTSGPSPKSSVVGRAQGLFASTSLADIGYHMTFEIVFTGGEFNGSTLSIAGTNPFMKQFRELPVVGGSGVFRLARGTAMLNTVTLNKTSGDAIVEYNVIVVHYQ